jgi:Flp pilus assembly protein TadG
MPGLFRTSADIARRIRRREDGVTAVEFALVAPVFMFLVFAILETSLMYVVATVMQGEVALTTRIIRTGQLQQEDDAIAAFRDSLCENLDNVLDCDNVIIDVRTFDDFGEIDLDDFVDEDGNASGNQFTPGSAGEIVVVRVAYQYNIVTPYLDEFLPTDANGNLMLFAGTAFKNEPFENAL